MIRSLRAFAAAFCCAATVISGMAYLLTTPTAVRANLVQANTAGPPPTWTLISHTAVMCGVSPCENHGVALTTPAITTTGADLIVAVTTSFMDRPTGGCAGSLVFTDSKSNTWSTAVNALDNGTSGSILQMWYVRGGTVGTGHTFTMPEQCFNTIFVLAFSGSIASPLDQTNSGTSAGSNVTTIASGSITPTVNNELIISGLTLGGSGQTSIAVNSSLTQADAALAGLNAQSFGTGEAYFAQGTAAAINPTWTWVTGVSAAAVVASFKP